MRKIELTVSPGYVPGWSIVDAIRELFQNAIDQEQQVPDNTMDWEYIEEEEKLIITNAKSVLTASTLLLGSTTKADNSATIGQFGEGYKIATLVLLRNDKKVTFYNYGAREIWRPRFVKSRKFETEILTFFIEKPSLWEEVPNANLTIEIEGITKQEWFEDIVPSNLYIRDDYTIIETTQYGNVIDIPGKVFVKGLYVCDYEPYKYSYNFDPGYIRLDRDRKMLSDFDLRWLASKLWAATKSNKVLELLEENAADVAHLDATILLNNADYWQTTVAKKFRDAYGPEAIPVTSQVELEAVPHGYKGIIVSETYNKLVRTKIYVPDLKPVDDAKARLQEFFDDLVMRYDIAHEDVEAFNEIIEEL